MNIQPLWTSAELRAATAGALAVELAVTGLAIDSRVVQPGDLFIALRDQRDGHEFVPAAFAAGATCCMVDRDVAGSPLLRVADTLAGLTALGAAGRGRSSARVAAITGSVGKTGTKEMLRLMLGALGPTHVPVASYNNHWGVPLTLARMPHDTAWAAIEIGMNNPGEIAPLAALARPHVAAITTVGEAHVGHLGSVEAIADEKASIVSGLLPGGVAVLPRDNPHFPRLAAAASAVGARILGFGRDAEADVRLHDASTGPDGTTARFSVLGLPLSIAMPAVGLHHAENAACALAVVAALGGDVARAAPALAHYAPGAGRGAAQSIPVPGGTALLLDDSYNGQPPAMRAALRNLALRQASRRVAVLGDMRELGGFSAELHRGLAAEATAAADLVFCCGPEMQHLFAALPVDKQGALTADSTSLAPLVKAALRPGDAVLVKGSLGSRMAVIIRALTETSP